MSMDYPAIARAEEALFADLGVSLQMRKLELEVDGTPVSTRVAETGAGAPVVLVHGGGGGLGHWAPLVPHLRDRRLILLERPGCGQASRFDYRGIDLERHAVAFIEATLDALGLRQCDLVGNSMGGLWSLWFASARPERVRSLALVGTPAIFPGTSAPPLMLQAADRQPPEIAEAGLPDLVAERIKLEATGHGATLARGGISPALLVYLASLKCRPYFARDFHALIGHCIDRNGAVAGAGISLEDVAALPHPALVIWGENDTYGTVGQGRAVAERMRDARFSVIPDAGHLPWIDNPGLAGQWLQEFIAQEH